MAAPDVFRNVRLADLQAMHSGLLLAVVEEHGVAAAMHLVGSSLQWLASLQDHAELRRSASQRIIESAPARWRSLTARALALPDPWATLKLDELPLERATRWQWTGTSWVADELLIRCERAAFARGAMRQCHRLRLQTRGRSANFIAKAYQPPSREALEADVMLQMRAKELAREFNARQPPKPVDFLQCWMLERRGKGGEGDAEWFAGEAFLEGPFVKMSSNSGFVSDEVVRNTPHAFSHFSFEQTSGTELVVDIQATQVGVDRRVFTRSQSTYVSSMHSSSSCQGVGDLYTDPQIHTVPQIRDGRPR